MGFQLPSIVFTTDTYELVIQRIKSENRSIGQFLGKGAAGKKIDERQKESIKFNQDTLTKYQKILENSEPTKRYIVKPKSKTGQGMSNVINYKNLEKNFVKNCIC